MTEFGALNWSILIVYIVANLLLGLVIGKKIDTADDFYLGQKQLPGGQSVYQLLPPM